MLSHEGAKSYGEKTVNDQGADETHLNWGTSTMLKKSPQCLWAFFFSSFISAIAFLCKIYNKKKIARKEQKNLGFTSPTNQHWTKRHRREGRRGNEGASKCFFSPSRLSLLLCNYYEIHCRQINRFLVRRADFQISPTEQLYFSLSHEGKQHDNKHNLGIFRTENALRVNETGKVKWEEM